MNIDITFKTQQGRFNYRVCGIITQDRKLLVMKDQGGTYYYLPGGRVSMNETAEQAMIREIREELRIDVEIDRALWVNQAFFKEDESKDKFHELCIYFLLDSSQTDLLSNGEKFILTEGEQEHLFEWISFDHLEDCHLYPTFIKTQMDQLPQTLTIQTQVED